MNSIRHFKCKQMWKWLEHSPVMSRVSTVCTIKVGLLLWLLLLLIAEITQNDRMHLMIVPNIRLVSTENIHNWFENFSKIHYKFHKPKSKYINEICTKQHWTLIAVIFWNIHAQHLPQILTHLLLLMYQIIFARSCTICQAIKRCRIGVGLRWQWHMVWRNCWWTQRHTFAGLLQKFGIHFKNSRLII